jgi:hypothetical protein
MADKKGDAEKIIVAHNLQNELRVMGFYIDKAMKKEKDMKRG